MLSPRRAQALGGICRPKGRDSGPKRQPSIRPFEGIQPDSEQFRSSPRTLRQLWRTIAAVQDRSRQQSAETVAIWRGNTKRSTPRATLGSGKLEDRAMSTSDDVQKRNAFAACAEFRIEGLEASLHHAREIAVRDELGVVGRYIAEAQGYLAQIRLLHQAALDEFRRPVCLLDRTGVRTKRRAGVRSDRSGGLNWMAGGLGFEPRLTESESAVLPLNYPPSGKSYSRV